MIPTEVPPLEEYRGDAWEGIDFGPILFDGLPPPAKLKSCRLYFRDKLTKAFGYGLKSVPTEGFGQIYIVDSTTWYIRIYEQPLPLAAKDWLWDLECTDENDLVKTPYKGTLSMQGDITYDDAN